MNDRDTTNEIDALHDLLRRVAGDDATFVETHISVLAFGRERVFKARKPVAFDFVDLSTPELRLTDCQRELELNRRLAPDVYLGVVELTGEHDAAGEYAVEMRRMPESQRLSRLLATDATAAAHCLDRVARLLAAFHASAAPPPDIDAVASRDAVAALWERGFAETQPFIGAVLDPDDAATVERLARRFLEGRAPLFDARIAAGRVRDGHGDLLCDDVFCLADGPRILDCLEFDDHLRAGDVLADVAFLAMDVESSGHADLARIFLDAYRATARDAWPSSLEHFYIAYRAHIRAKVACLRDAQGDPDARDHARARLQVARAHLEIGRPRLVLIGGLPGTGKSTVARELGARRGWPVLRSDEVRKELAGIDPAGPTTNAYGEGLYAYEQRAAVYDALIRRARDALAAGESVVLDASWADAAWRHLAADAAAATKSDVMAFQCVAPAAIAHERIARRRAGGADPSDADERIATLMAQSFDPWPDARELATDRPAGETLGTIDVAVQ